MARYYPSKLGPCYDDDDSQEEIWEDIQFNREPKADRFLPPLTFTFEDRDDGPSSSSSVLPGPSQERQELKRPFKKTTDPRLIKRRQCPTPPPNEEIPHASASSSNLEVQELPQNITEDSKIEDADADEPSPSRKAEIIKQCEIILASRGRVVTDEMPPFEFDLPIEFDIVSDDEEEATPPFVVGEMQSVTPATRRRRRPLRSDSENSDDPLSRRNLRKVMPCLYCHMWRHGIKAYRAKLRNAKMMLRIIKEMIRTRQEEMEKQ